MLQSDYVSTVMHILLLKGLFVKRPNNEAYEKN